MPASYNILTQGADIGDKNFYSTASISPEKKKPILVCAYVNEISGQGAPPEPIVTGNGITYTKIHTTTYTVGTNVRRTSLYVGASDNPTTDTVDFDYSGNQQADMMWLVLQWDGLKQTGSNATDCIAGSAVNQSNSTTSLAVTLPTFKSPKNPAFGFISGIEVSGEGPIDPYSVGSGFTEIAVGTIPHWINAEWKNSADTTVDWSFTDSSGVGAVAVELQLNDAGLLQASDI